VTAAGTLNICSANMVDSAAPAAPGSGNPRDSHAFGRQLRDAKQSLSSTVDHPAAKSATEPERAAARRAEKKGQADSENQSAAPLPVASSSATPLPVPLRFSLPPDSGSNAPEAHGGPDPNAASAVEAIPPSPFLTVGQQDTAADPVGQAVPGQSDPAQTIPSQAAPPDLSFAVQVGPQDPSAAVPPPAPVEVPVQLKLNDLAGQNDAGKNNPKPAGSATGIDSPAPANEVAGSVTPIKETQHTDLEHDPSAPGAGIFARHDAFQPSDSSAHADGAGSSASDAARAQESAALQSVPADHVTKPSAPLKDLSIQVGQTQQDKVELRVVERAGALEVAVRSANPDLNQGLRQGLSELVNRLEQNGFHAEAWRPGTTASTIQGTADTRQKSPQFQQDGSQSQSGSQQGRQQNQQNQTPRPRWVQELEGRLSGEGNAIAGGSYGVSSN